jgi:hypothetical protein
VPDRHDQVRQPLLSRGHDLLADYRRVRAKLPAGEPLRCELLPAWASLHHAPFGREGLRLPAGHLRSQLPVSEWSGLRRRQVRLPAWAVQR